VVEPVETTFALAFFQGRFDTSTNSITIGSTTISTSTNVEKYWADEI